MITIKPWGTTVELLKSPFCEFHRALIKKGGKSSIHKHLFKINYFFVESGRLIIREFDQDQIVNESLLTSGNFIECKAGILHQFEALEDTVLFEIYTPVPICNEDIERKS